MRISDWSSDVCSSDLTIIGPNGAGKTTLLRAIMGLVPLTQGAVRLDGRPLDGTPTWKMPDLGVVMIPEGRMIFKDMTIEENLMLGAFSKSHRAAARSQCDKASDMFPTLPEPPHLPAGRSEASRYGKKIC